MKQNLNDEIRRKIENFKEIQKFKGNKNSTLKRYDCLKEIMDIHYPNLENQVDRVIEIHKKENEKLECLDAIKFSLLNDHEFLSTQILETGYKKDCKSIKRKLFGNFADHLAMMKTEFPMERFFKSEISLPDYYVLRALLLTLSDDYAHIPLRREFQRIRRANDYENALSTEIQPSWEMVGHADAIFDEYFNKITSAKEYDEAIQCIKMKNKYKTSHKWADKSEKAKYKTLEASYFSALDLSEKTIALVWGMPIKFEKKESNSRLCSESDEQIVKERLHEYITVAIRNDFEEDTRNHKHITDASKDVISDIYENVVDRYGQNKYYEEKHKCSTNEDVSNFIKCIEVETRGSFSSYLFPLLKEKIQREIELYEEYVSKNNDFIEYHDELIAQFHYDGTESCRLNYEILVRSGMGFSKRFYAGKSKGLIYGLKKIKKEIEIINDINGQLHEYVRQMEC